MSTSKSIVTPTPVSRKYVVLMVCASLALVHLIGLMCALNEMTHNMYATQGKELHCESFFVPLMTLTPLPLILAMISIIIFAVKKNMQWILNLLTKILFIQTLVFISIPVLLAALERELNAAVLISSGLCIFLTAAFTIFISILQQEIHPHNHPHISKTEKETS